MARLPETAAVAGAGLIVLSLLFVLAPGAAADDAEQVFRKHQIQCVNNVRQWTGLLEVVGKEYPRYPGPNLVLYLVKKGEVRPKHYGLLFCPGDNQESLKAAGGAKAYANLDLKKRTYGNLTSYAGRDQLDKQRAAKRGVAKMVVLICDDSMDHHAGRGLVVGLTGGAAKWRDKVKDYKLKKDAQLAVGKGSTVQELTCLRAD